MGPLRPLFQGPGLGLEAPLGVSRVLGLRREVQQLGPTLVSAGAAARLDKWADLRGVAGPGSVHSSTTSWHSSISRRHLQVGLEALPVAVCPLQVAVVLGAVADVIGDALLLFGQPLVIVLLLRGVVYSSWS